MTHGEARPQEFNKNKSWQKDKYNDSYKLSAKKSSP